MFGFLRKPTNQKVAPVDTGLGFGFSADPGYTKEVFARDLHLEMRDAPRSGVNFAQMDLARYDLTSRGLWYVKPDQSNVPQLGADLTSESPTYG